jgi:hypothetical protein
MAVVSGDKDATLVSQGQAPAVELYADTAGGLYIFPEGKENGFYMTAKVPGGLFRNDARDIAGGHTGLWRIDLPGATRSQALNVGATHVATWKNGEVTVHQRPEPGSNARRYLGMG